MSKILVLRNNTDLNFYNISSEYFRTYDFIDKKIVIKNPAYLAVTDNGHRILDCEGICHYIPKGWIHLKWLVKDERPHFEV